MLAGRVRMAAPVGGEFDESRQNNLSNGSGGYRLRSDLIRGGLADGRIGIRPGWCPVFAHEHWRTARSGRGLKERRCGMKVNGRNLQMVRGDSEAITVKVTNKAGELMPLVPGDTVYFQDRYSDVAICRGRGGDL